MRKLSLAMMVCLLTIASAFAQSNTNVSVARAPFRANNDQITRAQSLLKTKGIYSGEPDGKLSTEFRAALKDFQNANGLKNTGTLNRATLEKLGITLTDKQKQYPVDKSAFDTSGNASRTSSKTKRASFRANKSQIEQAQKFLKDKGLFAGEADGKSSKEFKDSVKLFQSANELKRKGSLNRATLEKMGIKLTDAQSETPVNQNDLAVKGDDKGPSDKKKGPVFRATKDQIIQVQKILKTKGLYTGDLSGKLDPITRAAIREWQAQNGVKKTGSLNKETLLAMSIELTDRQASM